MEQSQSLHEVEAILLNFEVFREDVDDLKLFSAIDEYRSLKTRITRD